jgi:maltose alpha-D-glucosyltransferase/alpha-amylase
VLHPSNHKVLAFVRTYQEEGEDEVILVVANLSRFVEYVELDLSRYRGQVAVELFGGRHLPPIGDLPYLLTLGPHSFYWLRLEEPSGADRAPSRREGEVPRLRIAGGFEALWRGEGREALERVLPEILPGCRWFGGKSQPIDGVQIVDVIRAPNGDTEARILLAEVRQADDVSTYALPVAFASGGRAEIIRREQPGQVLVEVGSEGSDEGEAGVLWDALADPDFCDGLLETIRRRRRLRGERGELVASRTRAFESVRGEEEVSGRLIQAEQSNSSVRYGDRLMLKLFRRISDGVNPDLEIGRFLTEHSEGRQGFPHAPPVAGALEYRVGRGTPATLAMLQGLVVNEGDAWTHALDDVERFLGRVPVREDGAPEPPFVDALEASAHEPSELAEDLIGSSLESIRLLGQRTAELHVALASAPDDPAFAPEPFGSLYQRSLYQSVRTSALRRLQTLRERRGTLQEGIREDVDALLALEERLLDTYGGLLGARFGGMRIRCHGDYHLGQVLRTGNDFTILDFEGEPARPLSERRLKRSPLTDVAGMLRSFDYAVATVLISSSERGLVRPMDLPALEGWARFWRQWMSASFLGGYLEPSRAAGLVPADDAQLRKLLDALCLDKAVYEIGYELDHRPEWLRIPIRGIRERLEDHG